MVSLAKGLLLFYAKNPSHSQSKIIFKQNYADRHFSKSSSINLSNLYIKETELKLPNVVTLSFSSNKTTLILQSLRIRSRLKHLTSVPILPCPVPLCNSTSPPLLIHPTRNPQPPGRGNPVQSLPKSPQTLELVRRLQNRARNTT